MDETSSVFCVPPVHQAGAGTLAVTTALGSRCQHPTLRTSQLGPDPLGNCLPASCVLLVLIKNYKKQNCCGTGFTIAPDLLLLESRTWVPEKVLAAWPPTQISSSPGSGFFGVFSHPVIPPLGFPAPRTVGETASLGGGEGLCL